jgi:hypothetical protein
MSLHDHHGGHLLHVWARRDAQCGWSWCFAIDGGAATCSADESFGTEALALLEGEAAARVKIDRRVPQPDWRRWARQYLPPESAVRPGSAIRSCR